ncbi:MAG: AAA family ATPase [Acidimicrobiia bacterium]|nr:AAA family ATPase [Acidimicrobiia bacterium]
MRAFQVDEETGTRIRESRYQLPFVGRATQVARLRQAVLEADEGHGSVFQVVGETGVGKSRLVSEALDSGNGLAKMELRAEPYSSSNPYRPFRDELRRMLGVETGGQAEMVEQLRSVVRALDPALVPLLPLLGDVTQIDIETTPEVADIEPRFRRDRVADVIVRTLELTSPGPLAIVAEDSHWMDEASVHLLHRLAEAAKSHGWLLVATHRDNAGGFTPSGEELALQTLSPEESSKLVQVATEGTPLRPHEIEAIVTKAGGNPLFLQEIVSAVREAGGADTLPENLEGIVNAQIDALAPLPHQLLRFASVLGRSFRVDVLEALLETEDVALDSTSQDDLAQFLEEDGEGRWRFRHALIRDVAYEGLPFRRRRDLHQRTGLAIERLAGVSADAAADQLALHFSLAEDRERAWHYGCIAGDKARALYANVEASEHYERALKAAGGLAKVTDHEAAEVWTRLGDAREDAGLFDSSLDAYRKASQLVSDDPVLRAQSLYKRARARERSGAYSLALRELTTAESLLRDEGDSAAYVRAQLLATRAQVHQAQEKPHETLRVAAEAVTQAEASGNREALASAYVRLDWAHLFLGQPDKAIYGNRALAIFKELGDLGSQAIVIGTAGIGAYFDGDWDNAVRLYEAGRDAFQRAGNAVHAAHAESNIGEVLINQERFDEAEPLLRDAIRVLQASGFLDGVAFGQIQLGRALTGLGRLDEADAVLQQAWDQARQLGITDMSAADAATFLAECKLYQGDATGALAILDESAPKDGGTFVWQGAIVSRVRAAVLAKLGRTDEAMEALEAGLADARQHDLAYEQGLLLRLKSQIGDPDPAAEREAAKLLTGLGVGRPTPV